MASRPDVTSGDVAELYAQGHPPVEIARRLRCSPALVYARLDQAGVARRRHDHVAPPRDVVVRMYVEERRTPAEIGAVVGKDAVTIRRYLRSWGVATRSFAESRVPPGCRPAPLDPVERGYLLGFVTGDMSAAVDDDRRHRAGIEHDA